MQNITVRSMTQNICEGASSGEVMGPNSGPRQPDACELKASGHEVGWLERRGGGDTGTVGEQRVEQTI